MAYNPSYLVRVSLFSRLYSQRIANVFHYATADGVSVPSFPIANVAFNFEDIVLTPLVEICSNQMTFVSVLVEELIGGIRLYDHTPVANVGLSGGDCMPSFVAAAFKSTRTVRGLRAGQKRFAGVPEGASNSGFLNTPFQIPYDNVAAALSLTLTDPGGINDTNLVPVVYSDTIGGQPRLIPIVERTVAWSFTGFSSQNTRKVGRGD